MIQNNEIIGKMLLFYKEAFACVITFKEIHVKGNTRTVSS